MKSDGRGGAALALFAVVLAGVEELSAWFEVLVEAKDAPPEPGATGATLSNAAIITVLKLARLCSTFCDARRKR